MHTKSARQAYRAGDKSDAAYSSAFHKAWFLACIASACSASALLGTTSAAIKAWSLACIASAADHTHCLAPPRQRSKPGSWHVSPAPAAHTHCLATPHQLSQPSSWHASRTPAAVQLIRTPWHHLTAISIVSHRCCETVVLGTCFQEAFGTSTVTLCFCAFVLCALCFVLCALYFVLCALCFCAVPLTGLSGRRACTPTPQQWAHIVEMLASARAGSPAAQSARTWVKRRRRKA